MTLKTSLFNKGIYKSTLRRYMWGAVLYFVILFISTSLPILLTVEPDDADLFMSVEGNNSLLYDSVEVFVLPIILAIGVSTVVGILVYRFLHSKKASVFLHGLPINRTSCYISTLSGALTLMFVPVILNGLILTVMALTAYSEIISVISCMVWIGLNMLCLFMMFACTTFVAMLTGNTFSAIVLNVLFHAVVPVVVVCFGYVAEQFLFGYNFDNAVMNSVTEGNFVVWIFKCVNDLYYMNERVFDFVRMYVNIGISVLLYVLGWVLYKKRNLETAEDVAGFKILNPVFKYLLTFLGATVAFAVFSIFIEVSLAMFVIMVAVATAIIYFASEMILKKNFRIWKKAYKGFLRFAVIYTLVIFMFAFTSFFGYETNVPKAEDVESVAVYSFYYDYLPTLDNPELIDYAINLHKDFVSNRTFLKDNANYITIDIEYNLKNGKSLSRSYHINEKRLEEILSDLYEFEEYKAVYEPVSGLDTKDIQYISVHNEMEARLFGDSMKELHKCVVEDIKNMSYDDLVSAKNYSSVKRISYSYLFKGHDGKPQLHTDTYSLTSRFVKTNEWLKNNGDKISGYMYSYTNQLKSWADFCIINQELYKEIAGSFEEMGLNFEGLSWSKDELLKGYDVCNELTRANLENESVICVEGEASQALYEYVMQADNSVSYEGLWYIYGEVEHDKYCIVDAVTSEEAEAFIQSVCK